LSHSEKPFCCDLCFGKAHQIISKESPDSSQLAICQTCGLIAAHPLLSPQALDSFYDDSFANDPGSHLQSGAGPPDREHIKKEEVKALKWGVSLICQYVNPTSKKFLDIRCRTGVLSSLLQKQGATVICVEPFPNNAKVARDNRKLSPVVILPFSKLDQFPPPENGGYDVINILAHHVLAHVLSPRVFLQKVYESLKPEGFLFLDEKDIYSPVSHKKPSVLATGQAHQFHLSVDTTFQYLRSVGFHVLECQLDKTRKSDFRHIRVVAQRPPNEPTPFSKTANSTSISILQHRLWFLEKTWRLRLFKLYSKRKFKKMFRSSINANITSQ
jgi:SAM-dependent methyltransferase